MSDLPFQLLPSVPAQFDDGPVRLRISLNGPLQPDQQHHDAAEEAVGLFQEAVEAQLLGVPGYAHCQIIEAVHRDHGLGSDYTLEVAGIEPCDLLVLVSLLAQNRHAEDLVEAVIIDAPSGRPYLPLADFLETGSAYADIQVPDDLPFIAEISDDELSNAKYRFTNPLTKEAFTRLEEGIWVWGRLVHLGGFCFDWEEQEDFTQDFGRAVHVLPRVVDHLWPAFDGWRGAYTPLIRLARHFHREVSPLVQLTLA